MLVSYTCTLFCVCDSHLTCTNTASTCLIGANFSFHKEKAKAIPEQGKVVCMSTSVVYIFMCVYVCVCVCVCVCVVTQGSVWKRHNPQQEIDVRERDQFWSQQEVLYCNY